MKKRSFILLIIIILAINNLFSQQVADTSFSPALIHPEYGVGKGPVVMIDEGHNNFHTASGRYLPFARLLKSDGYLVKPYKGEFYAPHLEEARILVISNALNEINVSNWYLPTPSAFTVTEIDVLKNWVNSGGSLFLIADHMPMGGAAADLAKTFGFRFTNGFALDTLNPGPAYFYRKDNTLTSNLITNGRNTNEMVSKAVTFTGQGFTIPPEATSILKFDDHFTLLESDTAWVFDKSTRYSSINGWSQGAYMNYGKGRLVMFGEAAMFSAQLAGPQQIKVGMNSDYADENYKLLLNIIHWLDNKK
jgi:hypothetical protein